MRQILVAVDESEASERVAEFVNAFFGDLDVSVTAVNVGSVPLLWGPYAAPPGSIYGWDYSRGAPPDMVPIAADAEAEARHAGEKAIASAGIEAADRVVELGGDVADTIRQVAAERDVDMIVVGSNDKGFLDRLVSPSVSKDIAQSAPTPVLVVH